MEELIKVLYVDDEPMNLRLFTANFKSRFEVVTAISGEKGLDLIRTIPDIKAVISDMRMPEMDGMQFIRLAKKDHPSLSFFILTGYDLSEDISDAMKEGIIQKFFRKPFNIDDIEESVKAAVQ